MPYIVKLFDGLAVPEYIRPGDSQDMGTGAALTSFLQLPGGGYYDNYRDRTSPQGIRPINKTGVLWGTDAELRAQVDSWRAKLGKRGRLTVEFDDGSMRWQWARLQDVSTPRSYDNRGGWCPIALTWITAAQNWRGYVYDAPSWEWGDESWFFGDGSTGFGVGATTYTVTTSGTLCTVTHNGAIDAGNVTLRFEMTGSWDDLTVINRATGQRIYLNRSAAAATPWLEINAGARSIYSGAAAVNLSSISRTANTATCTTASGHGMTVAGDPYTVRIEDTELYDGDYYPAYRNGSDTLFYVALSPFLTSYGTSITGSVRVLTDLYSLTDFSDRARWLVLAPGDNVLEVTWNTAPTSASMTVEFVDHYA